ncbi:hypothetical protein AVEN_197248-1 [Araneus ventricosus]|uniref:Uncharacterized protein n=1 Tax=Araneus ventricosus TaxID=182803 RepID=A0A4Y2JLB6_ARAVE|nr:hypothetical protein AVEN_197248-1 [Araneus ventricosus]
MCALIYEHPVCIYSGKGYRVTINNVTPSYNCIRVDMKDRPPRQHSQALKFLHYSLYYDRLMQQPRIKGVRPLCGDGPKEPHHHYCTIELARVSLLIRQPLIHELAAPPSDGVDNGDKGYF